MLEIKKIFCDSLQMAREFERQHQHVLRDTDKLTRSTSGLSEKFREENFIQSTYKDLSGKKNRKILYTKYGFIMSTMEMKTKRARVVKESYIDRFNQMEEFIKSLETTRIEFPFFTDSIMSAHEEPKHYHFSNEINMIYRIVLGMTAQKFRILKSLEKGAVIKPYLTLNQIKAVEALQRIDIGLLVAVPLYDERKRKLTNYYQNKLSKLIA